MRAKRRSAKGAKQRARAADVAKPPGKIDEAWFRAQLSARRISQRELARLLSLDVSLINRSITGKRPFKLHEVTELASTLGVSYDELMRRLGHVPPTRSLEIGYEVTNEARVVPLATPQRRELDLSSDVPAGSWGAVFGAESGTLSALYGQVAIFPPLDTSPSISAFDRLAVVKIGELSEWLLGTIRRGRRIGAFRVSLFGTAEVRDTSRLLACSPVTSIRQL